MKQKTKSKKEPVFAAGWCAAKIFMFFVIGSMIGTWYEEILNFAKFGTWESRAGIIYGPFNPIYGLGFALFAFFLGRKNDTRKWYMTFLYSALLGGAIEYVISFMGEMLIQVKSWDYSGYFLNIDGRTTVPFMLFWGFGGLVFMRFLYPLLSKLIEKIPAQIAKYGYPVLVVFMCLNMFISYTALIRQSFRKQGIPPFTVLGEVYDKIYPDEFLEEIYPNMEHGTGKEKADQ